MELGRQWRIARRWILVIVAAVVLSGVGTYVVVRAQPPVYEASASLRVGLGQATLPDYNAFLASAELSKYYAFLATTRPLLTRVIADLGLDDDAERLRRRVGASAESGSGLVTITAKDGDPVEAARIADGLAQELIASSGDVATGLSVAPALERDLESIRRDIDVTTERISELESLDPGDAAASAELATLRDRLVTLIAAHATVLDLSLSTGSSDLEYIVPPIPPEDPIEPRPAFYSALAAMAVFFVITGLAFITEYLRDTLDDIAEIEEATGLPVVGSVLASSGRIRYGAGKRLVSLGEPDSPATESYKMLRVHVELMARDKNMKTLLVTGTARGDRTDLTAANLAVAFAESGRKVLLIDADIRRPRLHEVFDVPNDHGLTTLLAYDNVDIVSVTHATAHPNLRLLTTGSTQPNPLELLGSLRMRDVVSYLLTGPDMLIFDSPAITDASVAIVLGSAMQRVLLIVTRGRSRRRDVVAAVRSLTLAHASVVGSVVVEPAPRARLERRDRESLDGDRAEPKNVLEQLISR